MAQAAMTFPPRVMDDIDRRHQMNFVASLAQAPAQVDIFVVKKKAIVEAVQFFKYGRSKQHEHACDPVW